MFILKYHCLFFGIVASFTKICNNRVGRFKIPFDGSAKGELVAALNPSEHGRGMDMCSINPAYLGKKYRYAYACGAQRPCNFPNTLTKVHFLDTCRHVACYTFLKVQNRKNLMVVIFLHACFADRLQREKSKKLA